MNAITPADQPSELLIIEPGQLDQNPAAVYIASLRSARSRATMIQALNEIARMLGAETVTIPDTTSPRRKEQNVTYLACNWSTLRYQQTAALSTKLAETYKPATANKMLAAVRGVLKEVWRLGQMSAEEYHRAIDLKGIKGSVLPAGRRLSEGEILALVSACLRDKTAAGTRDAAIIGTLYTTGQRRAELVGLDLADLADDGKLTIRNGKGRKDRIVYITNGALTALSAWLAIRGNEAGPLFVPVNKGGNIQSGHRMTTQAIYNMAVKRADEAGVENFSPHDFRRTFCSDLLDRGADINNVSKLMGHADVKTTARYDHRPEEAKRQTAGLLHFPYSASRAPQQTTLPDETRQVGRAKSRKPSAPAVEAPEEKASQPPEADLDGLRLDTDYVELIKAALNKRAGWVYMGPLEAARRGVKLLTYLRANELADLERAGLVSLTPTEDGQKATIRLTEAGKAAILAMPDDLHVDFYPLPVDIAKAKARVKG